MSIHKLPQTDSIRELAQFWDSHDLTDFEDQLEEIVEPVFDKEAVITLRLESNEVQAVRKLAQTQGIDEAALIRSWILQHLG